MTYLDTSCLLKLYAFEIGSEKLVAWLTGRAGIACARHGRLELVAALKRHQREGRLDVRGLNQSLMRLEADENNRLVEWLPVDTALINSACDRLAALSPGIILRAADALHLTCAAEAGFKEIHSHDKHLLTAAPHFGLRGVDVIKSP